MPSGKTIPRVTQVQVTVLSAYDGEDQSADKDPNTGSDDASTDLAISDMQIIPARLPR